jgi:hypothetical protein
MKKQIFKRSIFWGVLLAVVAAVAFMLGRSQLRSATSFGFADANKVCRLTFEQDGQRVELSKRGGRWSIKGAGEAQQDKVADVLYVLQMLEASYPLPVGLADSLRGGGLCVAVGDRLGNLRSYTLYKVDTLTVGVVCAEKP